MKCCACPQCQALDGAIRGLHLKAWCHQVHCLQSCYNKPSILSCLRIHTPPREVKSVSPQLNSGLALDFLWSIECGQNDTVCFLTISLIWLCSIFFFFFNYLLDFPSGALDKSLSANAGDTGSIPGPGRFHMLWSNYAHVPQLLSPRAGATEAHALGRKEKPPQGEACGPQ